MSLPEPEFFTAKLYSLTTSYETALIFWPVFAYFLESYFRAIGLSVIAGICVLLVSIQFLRRSRRPFFPVWQQELIVITGGAHGVGRTFVETLVRKHAPAKIIILVLSG